MAMGFGNLRKIKTITEVRQVKARTICKGTLVTIGRTCRFELEMDADKIVRRMEIEIPSDPSGFSYHISETSGTIRPKGAPPIAKEGRFRRVIDKNANQTLDDDRYRFVSVSGRLSREKYLDRVRLKLPANATKIQFP